jgi:hypothetical protein
MAASASGVQSNSVSVDSCAQRHKWTGDNLDIVWQFNHWKDPSFWCSINPKYFYSKPEIETDPKLLRGLHKCIETLCECNEVADLVTTQLGQLRSYK